jgi:hypothetical protein
MKKQIIILLIAAIMVGLIGYLGFRNIDTRNEPEAGMVDGFDTLHSEIDTNTISK